MEAGSAVGTGNPMDGDAVTVVERPLPTARAGEDLYLMAAGAKHPRCLTQVGGDAAIGGIGRIFIEHKRDFHGFVSSSRATRLATFRCVVPWPAASRSVLRADAASIASATPPQEFAPRAQRCATDATRVGIRAFQPLAEARAYAPSRYSRPVAPARSSSAASRVAWRHGPVSVAAAAPRPAAATRGGGKRTVTRAAALRRASSAAMRSRSRNGGDSAAAHRARWP